MPLTLGQILQNRYRVAALLGQGGMGAVYRAWDLRLQKPVALKEMVPQSGLDPAALAQFRAQFRQEAVTVGKLAHPHLVPVTDYFEESGNDYLVMAYVEGESLAARILRDGALPEAQAVAWAQHLLDALAYCHQQGVIHRDIKPQNVIITPDGKAVLVDFGLVKLWDPRDPRTKTVMRGVGTPEYAPPEQWGALDYHTDPRSDLYSMGATLYHALTGQAPLTASDRMAYPKQFKTPRELTGRVSAEVDAAITRAMALVCDDRWPNARAMAQALAIVPPPRDTVVAPAAPHPARTQWAPAPAETAGAVAPRTVRASSPDAGRTAPAQPARPADAPTPASPDAAGPDLSGRRRWMASLIIIAVMSLFGCVGHLAFSYLTPDFEPGFVSVFLMSIPGLSFGLVYFTTARKQWWPVIPGGLLLTYTAATHAELMVGTQAWLAAICLGIGATLALLYFALPPTRRKGWLLLLSGLPGTFGLLIFLPEDLVGFIIVLTSLILLTGYILLRDRAIAPSRPSSPENKL